MARIGRTLGNKAFFMTKKYEFSRLEFAGSLGDLGTLLPLAMGMILINGLDAAGLWLSVGLFYIFSGVYFGVTTPVQPMKVIGAYAVATGITASQISAAGLLIGVFLLIIAISGAITLIGKYTPKAVVRGVQLSTGALLMAQGVRFIVGTAKFQLMRQAAEPYLSLQSIGPLPIGIVIGAGAGILTLLLLNSKKLPAGLVVVALGAALGLLLSNHAGFDKISLGLYLPSLFPLAGPELRGSPSPFWCWFCPRRP